MTKSDSNFNLTPYPPAILQIFKFQSHPISSGHPSNLQISISPHFLRSSFKSRHCRLSSLSFTALLVGYRRLVVVGRARRRPRSPTIVHGRLQIQMVQSRTFRGTRYSVGECVRVNTHEDDAAKIGKSEFVGKILGFSKTKRGIAAKLNWYYWPEETRYINVKSCGEREVYESLLIKLCLLETIISKCTVHHLWEYCKLPIVTDEDFYCHFRVNKMGKLEFAGGGPAGRVPVYCLCRQMYNPDRSMVECDICKSWFHYDCIGSTPEKMKNVSDYACEKCKNKKSEECKNQGKGRKVIRSNYESFESAMVPLTREQKLEVEKVFSRPESDDILVNHTGSNIAITLKHFFA